MKKTILICSIAALLAACGQKQETANATTPANAPATASAASAAQLPPGHPALTASAPATQAGAAVAQPHSQGKIDGTIAEAIDAAGYTYVNVKTAAGNLWAAVPQAKLKKGESVHINAQMVMDNFESKTLKRKFDKVVFGNLENADGLPLPASGMTSAAAPATQTMPPNHPGMAGGASPMGTPQQHMAAGAANVGDVKVAKADGGKTVAEVWATKDAAKDKPVVVRGKVVKFLAGIMGKNWMHLRDGSGSSDKGDNDITVTTSDTAAVGDTVTVTGTVRVDKDFGAGYRYPVIIEEAKVSKQ